MRFYLDNDVDERCRRVLTAAGHKCWSAREASRQDAEDDEQTIYAQTRQAVLVTHDKEFTERRKKMPLWKHVRLVCEQPDGPTLLERWLTEMVYALDRHADVVVELRPDDYHVFVPRGKRSTTG